MQQASLAFPNWHQGSSLDAEDWDFLFYPVDDHSCLRVRELLQKEQQLAIADGTEKLYEISEKICADIIHQQNFGLSSEILVGLQYLQFECTITPIVCLSDSRNFNRLHDWLLNGFSDSVSREIAREFYIERFDNFVRSDVAWFSVFLPESLQAWFYFFYYYCRRRSALPHIARVLGQTALEVAWEVRHDLRRFIDLLVSLGSWAASYDEPYTGLIVSYLEPFLFNSKVAPRQKASICVFLTTRAGDYSSKSSKFWAEYTLKHFTDELIGHEKLQVLVLLVDTEAKWKRYRASILEAIAEVRHALEIKNATPLHAEILLGQYFQLLHPAIYNLANLGLANDLADILCSWYGVADAVKIRSDPAFLFINHHDGMGYLRERHFKIFEGRWEQRVGELTEISNKVLNTALTVEGLESDINLPVRPGVPDYGCGPEFEEKLGATYQLDRLPANFLTGAQTVITLPGYSYPLQALLNANRLDVLPIGSSLEQPLGDRAVKRAAIWFAGNDLYSEMESLTVKKILRQSGIEVSTFSGTNSTRVDFFDIYLNPDLDLIWIAGHGEVDRWDPLSPVIDLGAIGHVSIEELLAIDLKLAARRLLVLNICDGAVAHLNDGLPRIGIAPMLAGRGQAVISHLWPVEPRVASVFGAGLAQNLSQDPEDYFGAFKRSLKFLHRSWKECSEDLEQEVDRDHWDRINNFEPDMSNILHWGSPCFFQ